MNSYFKGKAAMRKRATELSYGGGGPQPAPNYQSTSTAEQRGTPEESATAEEPPVANKPAALPQKRPHRGPAPKGRSEEEASDEGAKGISTHRLQVAAPVSQRGAAEGKKHNSDLAHLYRRYQEMATENNEPPVSRRAGPRA